LSNLAYDIFYYNKGIYISCELVLLVEDKLIDLEFDAIEFKIIFLEIDMYVNNDNY